MSIWSSARSVGAAGMVLAAVLALPAPAHAAAARVHGACDFDGDRYQDVAFGSPFDAIAGGVHVFYGGSGGLHGTRSQYITQSTPGIPGSPESHDIFGAGLACGDFDVDGFDDLAISAPGERIGEDGHEHGQVTVLYGTASGLKPQRATRWSEDSTGIAGDPSAGDRFGLALASGDFDDDGAADLAIGAPGPSWSGGGAVHVLYGRKGDGITAAGDELWHQDSPDVADHREQGDYCGSVLTAGDFDADGRDDLVFACEGELALHVLFGHATGLTGRNSNLLRSSPASLAVGRLNAGRADDLVMGGNVAVAVRYGAPGTGGVGSPIKSWEDTSPVAPEKMTNQFGYGLATGDVTGDGYDEVFVGAPGTPSSRVERAGSVTVLFGSARGVTARRERWNQDSANVPDITNQRDAFGWSLGAGDFDRDGYSDVAVGSPGEDIIRAGRSRNQAGAVFMLRGRSGGLTGTGSRMLTQQTDGVGGIADVDDLFGFSTAVDGCDNAHGNVCFPEF